MALCESCSLDGPARTPQVLLVDRLPQQPDGLYFKEGQISNKGPCSIQRHLVGILMIITITNSRNHMRTKMGRGIV